ncbi:MAG: hypothetical protein IIU28_01770 [Lachnospiraceae bacterium]|nr:hypothetical protein [Lachnospiraceae bacterium]
MSSKVKTSTKKIEADLSATVRDILDAGKEDSKKVAEEVKKATEEVKSNASKAVTDAKTIAKKASTTAKKTTTKAASTAKKTATKAASKATVAEPKVILQYEGNDYDLASILESAKKAYSKSKKSIKEVSVYVKPEDHKAYYVADGNVGSVDF